MVGGRVDIFERRSRHVEGGGGYRGGSLVGGLRDCGRSRSLEELRAFEFNPLNGSLCYHAMRQDL